MFKISAIIKQLQSEDWYNISEEVEIAKGRYALPTNFKRVKKQAKRVLKGRKIYV